MGDTSILVPEDRLDRFAQGHNRRRRPVSNWDMPSLAGAGALRSTVADLVRFLEAQLGGAPEPLAEAIRTTHEPRARFGAFEVGPRVAHAPGPRPTVQGALARRRYRRVPERRGLRRGGRHRGRRPREFVARGRQPRAQAPRSRIGAGCRLAWFSFVVSNDGGRTRPKRDERRGQWQA